MFAAAQCVGYRSEFGTTTYQMCYPDDKTVVKQVKKEVKRTGAHSVFVATDNRDLIDMFSKEIKKVSGSIVKGIFASTADLLTKNEMIN